MLGKLLGSKSKYSFSDPENTACLTCNHVLDQGADIVYVTHDADDGMWQFLCGLEEHESEDAKMISLGQISKVDASVNDLHEMPLGFGATRENRNAKWQPFKL